jgi:hypothetical protein
MGRSLAPPTDSPLSFKTSDGPYSQKMLPFFEYSFTTRGGFRTEFEVTCKEEHRFLATWTQSDVEDEHSLPDNHTQLTGEWKYLDETKTALSFTVLRFATNPDTWIIPSPVHFNIFLVGELPFDATDNEGDTPHEVNHMDAYNSIMVCTTRQGLCDERLHRALLRPYKGRMFDHAP